MRDLRPFHRVYRAHLTRVQLLTFPFCFGSDTFDLSVCHEARSPRKIDERGNRVVSALADVAIKRGAAAE